MLYNFGREEAVDKEALKRLVRSINRFLGPEEAIKGEADQVLKFMSSKPLGDTWFLDRLWNKLGIKGILEKLLKSRYYTTPVERAIFAMAANRALNPGSIREASCQFKDGSRMKHTYTGLRVSPCKTSTGRWIFCWKLT